MSYLCVFCKKEFSKTRFLTQHVNKVHGINSEQYFLHVFPGCSKTCIVCNSELLYRGYEHGFGYEIDGKKLCGKCSHTQQMKGREPPNKGKTKENYLPSAKTSQKLKERYSYVVHHCRGKTKENDENVKLKGNKISASLRKFYSENSHHNLGRTKEDTEYLARAAATNSRVQKGKGPNSVAIRKSSLTRLLKNETIKHRLEKSNFVQLGQYSGNQIPMLVRCTLCGYEQEKTLHAIITCKSKCSNCRPPIRTSRWEQEVFEFVSSLNSSAVQSSRTALGNGLEVDIFVEQSKFAIECNGLYWHSEASGRYSYDYHQKKSDLAREAGIDLLHLFEDEWENKKQLIKSIIAYRLGICEKKIYARKCVVKEISAKVARAFFEENHLDGPGPSKEKVCFGLLYNGELVAAMSLKKHIFSDALDIMRFASKSNFSVVGALGKLLAVSCKWAKSCSYNKIVTYVDGRFGNGTSYSKAGMKLVGTTGIRWYWTDCSSRLDRWVFRRKGHKKEREVAGEFVKIWMCKNFKFEIEV